MKIRKTHRGELGIRTTGRTVLDNIQREQVLELQETTRKDITLTMLKYDHTATVLQYT